MRINEEKLTTELHRQLKEKGYKYLLIENVEVNEVTGKLVSLTVSPIRTMLKRFPCSCTGIDDEMIVGILGTSIEIVLINFE